MIYLKKGGKYALIISAVFVAFLMVSSATAVNFIQSNKIKGSLENNNYEVNDEIYVDPNIYLAKADLVSLYGVINKVNDPEYKQISLEIIKLIETKGFADSEDIKKIIENSDTGVTKVYGPSRIKTTEASDGAASCIFAFPLITIILWDLGLHRPGILPRVGSIALYRYSDSEVSGWHLTINGKSVNKGDGLIIGFVGFLRRFGDPFSGWLFYINGFALLIFHKDSD